MTREDNYREMSLKKAVTLGWRNLFNFRGEVSRQEHWRWVLFVALFIIALMIIVAMTSLFMSVEYIDEESIDRGLTLVVFMGGEAICLILLPLLLISSQVGRFHDVRKNSIIPVF